MTSPHQGRLSSMLSVSERLIRPYRAKKSGLHGWSLSFTCLPTGQEKAGVFCWFLMLKRYTAIFGSVSVPLWTYKSVRSSVKTWWA